MSLKEKIQSDMKQAMKAREPETVSTLRMAISAIKKREIDERVTLTDPQVMKLLTSMVKQRADSIEAFKKGNRPDLVEIEEKEVLLLKSYLPEPVSKERVEAVVSEIIAELGAQGMKDMGKVIPKVMEKLAGAADGKMVSDIVRSKLS